MNNFRLLALSIALGAVFATPVRAQSLTDLYELARAYDATYQSAKAQYDANQYKADQAKASILPTVNLSAGVSNTQLQVDSGGTTSSRGFDNQNAGVNASQPLYRPFNLYSSQQGNKPADLADAQLQAAQQDLNVAVHRARSGCLADQERRRYGQAA